MKPFVVQQQKLSQHLAAARLSRYWSKYAKFIFVAVDFPPNTVAQASLFPFSNRLLNVIFVQELNGKVTVSSYNPFASEPTKMFYELPGNTSNIDIFYEDKLRNVNGYRYNLVGYEDYPRFFVQNNQVFGTDIYFLKTIARQQNAGISVKIIELDVKASKTIASAMNSASFDVLINTGVHASLEQFDVINTFDSDGFCALIPFPERKSIFGMFIKPFDSLTWIFIFITVITSSIVWHFLNKRSRFKLNSASYFMFSFIANLLGQGIPFREHRVMQKVLLQLSIVLTFVLSNAYQSQIISLISAARYGDKISTVDDLMSRNFSFLVDPVFKQMFDSSDGYTSLRENIIDIYGTLDEANFQKLASENVVIILRCSVADHLLNDIDSELELIRKPINFYYKLPQPLYTIFVKFWMTYLSPFGKRFQEASLKVFESGIKQLWKSRPAFENLEAKKLREYYENEEYLLNLKDLSGVFYILLGGLTIATFVFVLEILIDMIVNKFWRKPIHPFIN